MCGLTGYLSKQGALADGRTIKSMAAIQKHRGPDDSGFVAINSQQKQLYDYKNSLPDQLSAEANLFFGFNRLSILDLSVNGHQPMVAANGQVVLMMNGEVYNAFDYKDSLEKKGYRFRGGSDTEVVLNLYLEHGAQGMLEMLNGMFAIAICDLRTNSLLFARDQFGIKPLYLYEDDRHFAFSSELKSFSQLLGVEFALNENLISEFLLFRGNRQSTLLKGIRNLEPSCFMTLDLHTHKQRLQRFTPRVNSNCFSKQNLSDTLSAATKSQLLADVPVGTQLSGGVDSSLVTYYAAQAMRNGALETVSITFDDPLFSEEQYIKQVQDGLGLHSHTFLMDSGYYSENIFKATWHLEQPINHPNTVGILLISKMAKERVTVLLSGEGADELFGGYERFLDMRTPFFMPLLQQLKKELLGGSASSLYRYCTSEAWRTVMATAFGSPSVASQVYAGFSLKDAVEPKLDLFERLEGSGFARQRSYELKSYLPDLLMRQDKMSMAYSMENRVPFLDNNVAAYALSLDEEDLLRKHDQQWQGKAPLKQIAASIFGDRFAYRPKQGFGIPLRNFIARPGFARLWNDQIRPGIIKRGIFDWRTLDKIMRNLERAPIYELEMLWITMAFEVWAAQYLNRSISDVAQKYVV